MEYWMCRLDDGRIASRGRRITLIPREAGSVVPVNVTPNEALIIIMRGRGKPACTSQVSLIAKI